MIQNIFDPEIWSRVPFEFWAVVFFVLGTIVGSFLNVVIHRLPLGESIVSPPSHCPHCKYSIPWYLNIPLLTWLSLRGKCKNCGAPIAPRYFFVEFLTGVAFLLCWLSFGRQSPWLALIYCVFLAGLISGTFMDFEHYIIADEITIGGIIAGFLISVFFPKLHGEHTTVGGLIKSLLGIAVGGGLIYLVVRMGKLAFGRKRVRFGVKPTSIWKALLGGGGAGLLCSISYQYFYQRDCSIPEYTMKGILGFTVGLSVIYLGFRFKEFAKERLPNFFKHKHRPVYTQIVFSETSLHLPDEEIPYEDIFYRSYDTVKLNARTVELVDRCYKDVPVRLSLLSKKLIIGDDELNPEQVFHMEIVTDQIVLPREAMGFGDVKFMAAIGAFLGWPAVVFSLLVSSTIGAVVGLILKLLRKLDRLPYIPFISIAAMIWVFLPPHLQERWLLYLRFFGHVFFGIPMPEEPW